MSYGFLIYGRLDRDRLAAALADLLSLPVESVDVGAEDDDDRNWSAPVSCTVTPVTGELHWHLDIYLTQAVHTPPPEPVAAAWLANSLRTVVGYQAVPEPPSAYWLVGPDGVRTRARIYEEDADDFSTLRIDAVEKPLAALPGLPISAIPEVIRSYRMPTPVTDHVLARLNAADTPTDDAAAMAIRSATNRLGAWEDMVTRLVGGWPPDGWYPAEYYREDLETRDKLASTITELPARARDEIGRAAAEVDRRFAEATRDDGGQALAAATGAGPAESPGRPGAADRWWWNRIPESLPWQNAPGPLSA
ncbi:hypothetical protein AB0J80_24005 [Actinoplanes sp. NPDC049548]|uniref:hypothetical protein n=1 Tax=Actinoplanes sp. NPDC049548 TaxID=3155152 RepID=UPI003427104F